MATKKLIPDSYTTYEDGHLGVVPASLANVEVKIGAADGGVPLRVYTLSGPDAKKQAKTIFKGGALLHALEEAFDAGSTRIHAVRIGGGTRSSITLKSIMGEGTLKIKGDYGTSGNNHYVNVTQTFNGIQSGYAAVLSGNPNRVIFFDEAMNQVRETLLDPQIATVVGVEPEVFSIAFSGYPGVWVLGKTAAPTSEPTLWRFNESGTLDASSTISLAGVIPAGDEVTGISGTVGPTGGVNVVTNKRIVNVYKIAGMPQAYETLSYSQVGIANPDISSATTWMDLKALMRGDNTRELKLLLDRTVKKVYAVDDSASTPVLKGTIDISSFAGADIPEGIAVDFDNGDILVALRTTGTNDRVARLRPDWSTTPPTVSFVSEYSVQKTVMGLGCYIAVADMTTRVTLQDRNESPVVTRAFEATGGMREVTPLLAQAISQSGVYEADLLTGPAIWLMPSMINGGGAPDPNRYERLTGGTDSGPITNADYLAGIEATVSKTDTAWLHAVGANTPSLWNAILLHCSEMADKYHAERFSILETPEFLSTYEVGSAGYLTDLQSYVDGIVTMVEAIGDRNAVIFAGGASFADSDGVEYRHPVTSACGGVMSGLEVQKSLINKPVKNIVKLVPEFSPGHIETLIQNRVNCVRFKPGRGFIIAHSLTAAAVGSDYSRVNDLRAVYYGAKAAREAGQPYVGEENDKAGEGLRRLESAMSRPLEQMRDAGQIDDFELSAVSTAQDRLLGDVYVSLGIQPRRAMELIYTNVFLR